MAIKALYKTGNTNQIGDNSITSGPTTPAITSDTVDEDRSTPNSFRRSISHSVSEQSQTFIVEDEDKDDDNDDNDDDDLEMQNELDALLTYVGKDSFFFPFFTYQPDTVCF